MKLLNLIDSLILENFQLDRLKDKYVGEGKPVSDKDFQNILEVCNNKHAYVMFLTTRVANKLIMMEDIYKFKNYFSTFEKNKSLFDIKDINQYKTQQQIDDFKQKCISVAEKNVVYVQGVYDKDKYVSPNDIRKLESVGIKYLGVADGFQIFQVHSGLEGNRKAYEAYKTILGRCAGRDQGSYIHICTMGSFDLFNWYFNAHPDSSYFVMFNLGDPLSPYQIHFESGQFKDKNDKEYGIMNKPTIINFIIKNSDYTLDNVFKNAKPVDGKGTYDNNGKQGVWEEYHRNDRLVSKGKYKDGKKDGVWEEYHRNGQLVAKRNYKNGEKDGLWEFYHDNGRLIFKRNYKNGERIK